MKDLEEEKTCSLFASIEWIVEHSINSELKDDLFSDGRKQIGLISDTLEITEVQAVLFSIIVEHSGTRYVSLAQMARHLGCSNVRLYSHFNDFKALLDKKLISRKGEDFHQMSFFIRQDVFDALADNRSYVRHAPEKIAPDKVLDAIGAIMDKAEDINGEYQETSDSINELISGNPDLALSKAVKKMRLDQQDTNLLTVFCYLAGCGNDEIRPRNFACAFPDRMTCRNTANRMANRSHPLVENGYISNLSSTGIVEFNVFKMTDKGKKELLEEMGVKIADGLSLPGSIRCKDIPCRELYYNAEEHRQVDDLTKILSPDRFNEVLREMERNGMRGGFACLFYGAPGTGKTETVYQLARLTGRDILPVNVADIKSMWVGESEKNIRAVFTSYRNLCKDAEKKPILLFNEADAILGKRIENARFSADRSENSVQNIILEEMERLDGIMIATTNLSSNLDPAFERRFLYKIEFMMPDAKSRCRIWQSMLPGLAPEEARILGEGYEYSGGQIENIARKCMVEKILSGNSRIPMERIREICDSEHISRGSSLRNRIGF